MPSFHHLALYCTIGLLATSIAAVDAGYWRNQNAHQSWASIRRSPLLASSVDTNSSQEKSHTPALQYQSLFGVSRSNNNNSDLANNQRKQRYLASILATTTTTSLSIRGGGDIEEDDETNDSSSQVATTTAATTIKNSKEAKSNDDTSDDERYSRQMYALGARAHKLVRSTTAILDGPLGGNGGKKQNNNNLIRKNGADGFDGVTTAAGVTMSDDYTVTTTPSGLLYEIAKNLALSGVGRIILVQDDDDDDDDDDDGDDTVIERDSTANNAEEVGYFDGSYDDLGAAYHRAALAEISSASTSTTHFEPPLEDSKVRKRQTNKEEEEEECNSDMDDNDDTTTNHNNVHHHHPVTLDDGAILLSEYIQRLNPGVQVDIVSRSKLMHLLLLETSSTGDQHPQEHDHHHGAHEEGDGEDEKNDGDISLGTNPVIVCVDRSTMAQLEMDNACRGGGQKQGETTSNNCSTRTIPFLSVETAGVHAKLFCDFGPKFIVVDEDGETPRSTLLDRVVEAPPPSSSSLDDDEKEEEELEKVFTINCLEGERHDVSMGDVIEFQGEHTSDSGGGGDHPMMGSSGSSSNNAFPKCQVVSVKTPTCFMVKRWNEKGETSKSMSDDALFSSLLEGKARTFTRVKLPKQISFSSLRDILQPSDSEAEEDGPTTIATKVTYDDALFAPSDLDKSFDPLRRRAVMTSMAALDMFVKKYGRLPSRYSINSNNSQSSVSVKKKSKHHRSDLERFQSLVRKLTKDDEESAMMIMNNEEQWDMIITQFAQTCRAKFTPVQALMGALGAQEVLKAATGLYNPVRQFLLYDCDEVLQSPIGSGEKGGESDESDTISNEAEGEATSGQSYILGEQFSNKLARSRLFLVGAGAIGCELLKNLAAMGAGTGVGNTKKGCLMLTDMDTIEKSNLSRQLLFRDHDVGEFKSVAARSAMMRFSPECVVEAHTSRVGDDETDGPFDDDFWSSGCDVVMNALDNVEARLFVDSQCVAHGLGLIDAGTLGPKGNVQVVVPHESESYGSSADPPEPNIPVCTLKNFPYEISHTIQWARDLFDGYFYRRPRQANDHVEEISNTEDLAALGQLLIEKLGDDAAVNMAEELGEDLGPFPFIVGNADSSDPEYVLAVKRDSLNWAIQQAHRLFYVTMDELIQKHPVDSLDDDGAQFWSGTRRAPRLLRFIPMDSEEDEVSAQQVIINERIAQFVRSAARLRMESFLEVQGDDVVSLISLEEALVALDEQSKLLYKKKKSKEILHNLSGGGSSEDGDTLSLLLDKLNGAKTGASFLPKLNLADFEKDDESNGHVAFVTAASNLRAMAYGIPPADAMETRRVAGRIVPAMITTTGLVSALSCLELVKLLKGLPLTMHRNAFVNLALPFFAFTAPMPAEEVYGINGKTHTIWDRITTKGSSKSPIETMTLSKFLTKVQKKSECGEGVEIASVSYGPYMIYANFLHSHDEDLLETCLLDIVREAVISEDDDDDMSLFDEDNTDNEERPPIELTKDQKSILAKLEQKRFIDLSVTVEEQETGEEFELPPVRLMKEKLQQESNDDIA